MRNFKREKGITLVALVITIIVLLILAGITLAMVMGDSGIFGKANRAKEQTNASQAVEDIKLKILEVQTEKEGNATLADLVEKLENAQDTYKVTTASQVATLGEGSDAVSDLNAASKIYVTNTKYGYEIEIGNDLKIKNEAALIASGSTTTGETGNSGSGTGSGSQSGTGTVAQKKTLSGATTGFTYKNPVIPGGFTTVDTETAKWKYTDNAKTEVEGYNNGLVIQDDDGNQFVWVPCEGTYGKTTWGDAYKNNTWDSTVETEEASQVSTYGGFYVARYEAGTSEVTLTSGGKIGDTQLSASGWQNNSYVVGKTTKNSKPTSKKGEIPYYHADHGTAIAMAERMYKNNSNVESGLITGAQWDVMLNWMNDNKTDKSMLTTNCTWGNYNNTTLSNVTGKYCTINVDNGSMTSTWQTANWTGDTKKPTGYYLLSTGSTEDVQKKNIYDVAGNVWEWTMETAGGSDTDYYMLRGGSFAGAYASYPACFRHYNTVSATGTNYGFRVILYIK